LSLEEGSVELLGKGEVGQNSADLFGKGTIRQTGSAELFGKFEAQAIAELLGKAVIRHSNSEEFLGKFRASTDNWIIQGASVEAYIALDIVI